MKMTQELIPLTISAIGNEEQKTVNARDLHAFLEIGKDFSSWIKGNIEKYGFVEGLDFVKVPAKSSSPVLGSQEKIEYFLSLSMAKEIAMLTRNAKGKQARLYFIECEKIAKAKATPTQFQIPQTMQEALRLAADQMDKNAALQLENQKLSDKTASLENKRRLRRHDRPVFRNRSREPPQRQTPLLLQLLLQPGHHPATQQTVDEHREVPGQEMGFRCYQAV